MSDSSDNGSGTGSESGRESLWQRLRNRFGRTRDMGLRESLEGAIETHEAQNPGETRLKVMLLRARAAAGDVAPPAAESRRP